MTDYSKFSLCQVRKNGNLIAPLGKERVKLDCIAIEVRHLIKLAQGETEIAQNVDYVTNQLLSSIYWNNMRFQFDSQTAFQKVAETKQNFVFKTLDVYFYNIR